MKKSAVLLLATLNACVAEPSWTGIPVEKEDITFDIRVSGAVRSSVSPDESALEDLNLCFTFGDPQIIMQMTWLKTLWWSKTLEYHFTYSQRQAIQSALSNTYCNLDYGSSTSRGWRDLPNYFAQRDLHGMYYMTG